MNKSTVSKIFEACKGEFICYETNTASLVMIRKSDLSMIRSDGKVVIIGVNGIKAQVQYFESEREASDFVADFTEYL